MYTLFSVLLCAIFHTAEAEQIAAVGQFDTIVVTKSLQNGIGTLSLGFVDALCHHTLYGTQELNISASAARIAVSHESNSVYLSHVSEGKGVVSIFSAQKDREDIQVDDNAAMPPSIAVHEGVVFATQANGGLAMCSNVTARFFTCHTVHSDFSFKRLRMFEGLLYALVSTPSGYPAIVTLAKPFNQAVIRTLLVFRNKNGAASANIVDFDVSEHTELYVLSDFAIITRYRLTAQMWKHKRILQDAEAIHGLHVYKNKDVNDGLIVQRPHSLSVLSGGTFAEITFKGEFSVLEAAQTPASNALRQCQRSFDSHARALLRENGDGDVAEEEELPDVTTGGGGGYTYTYVSFEPLPSQFPTQSSTGTSSESQTGTGTSTPSNTGTATRKPSQTSTGTPTGTGTVSESLSSTTSSSTTPAPSDSRTSSASTSALPSASVTSSPEPSKTGTATSTMTASTSSSATSTRSRSQSSTPSNSRTPSSSITYTSSSSPSAFPTTTSTTTTEASATATASKSMVSTPSASASDSFTTTRSQSLSPTASRSETPSTSVTQTSDTSATTSVEASNAAQTQTMSISASGSVTSIASSTGSLTTSTSNTPTTSMTRTASVTSASTTVASPSMSVSASGTVTSSPSQPTTSSNTPSNTYTQSATTSVTASLSGTHTKLLTSSPLPSKSSTISASISVTETSLASPSNASLSSSSSNAPTPTRSTTLSPSDSAAATVSVSRTATEIRSASQTSSASATLSASVSDSAASTTTNSQSASYSITATQSTTSSISATVTATNTGSASVTSSVTPSNTATNTATQSESTTASATATITASGSRSATNSETSSASSSGSATATSSNSATASETSSATPSTSHSSDATASESSSSTASETPTPSSSATTSPSSSDAALSSPDVTATATIPIATTAVPGTATATIPIATTTASTISGTATTTAINATIATSATGTSNSVTATPSKSAPSPSKTVAESSAATPSVSSTSAAASAAVTATPTNSQIIVVPVGITDCGDRGATISVLLTLHNVTIPFADAERARCCYHSAFMQVLNQHPQLRIANFSVSNRDTGRVITELKDYSGSCACAPLTTPTAASTQSVGTLGVSMTITAAPSSSLTCSLFPSNVDALVNTLRNGVVCALCPPYAALQSAHLKTDLLVEIDEPVVDLVSLPAEVPTEEADNGMLVIAGGAGGAACLLGMSLCCLCFCAYKRKNARKRKTAAPVLAALHAKRLARKSLQGKAGTVIVHNAIKEPTVIPADAALMLNAIKAVRPREHVKQQFSPQLIDAHTPGASRRSRMSLAVSSAAMAPLEILVQEQELTAIDAMWTTPTAAEGTAQTGRRSITATTYAGSNVSFRRGSAVGKKTSAVVELPSLSSIQAIASKMSHAGCTPKQLEDAMLIALEIAKSVIIGEEEAIILTAAEEHSYANPLQARAARMSMYEGKSTPSVAVHTVGSERHMVGFVQGSAKKLAVHQTSHAIRAEPLTLQQKKCILQAALCAAIQTAKLHVNEDDRAGAAGMDELVALNALRAAKYATAAVSQANTQADSESEETFVAFAISVLTGMFGCDGKMKQEKIPAITTPAARRPSVRIPNSASTRTMMNKVLQAPLSEQKQAVVVPVRPAETRLLRPSIIAPNPQHNRRQSRTSIGKPNADMYRSRFAAARTNADVYRNRFAAVKVSSSSNRNTGLSSNRINGGGSTIAHAASMRMTNSDV